MLNFIGAFIVVLVIMAFIRAWVTAPTTQDHLDHPITPAEPTREEQLASWHQYARQLVDEMNRANGMIEALTEPKPYIVRRCSRRRCKKTTDQ